MMSGVSFFVPLADTPPLAEVGAGLSGAMPMASRADHEHPRMSATASGVLNLAGEAAVLFTRTFDAKPAVIITAVESADGQPIVFKVKTWTTSGASYTGCVIKGYRSQTIPTNLVTLLLGGVFNLFAGSASSAEYSLVAIPASS